MRKGTGEVRRLSVRHRHRRRLVFRGQMNPVDCGPACLAMVLDHYGLRLPLAAVREACASGRDGLTAGELLRTARRFGLEGKGFRGDAKQITTLPLPQILYWDEGHFVVLERVRKGRYETVDPSRGRQSFAAPEFSQHYSGITLCLGPNAGFQPGQVAPHGDLVRKILRSVPGLAGLVSALLVGSAGLAVLGLAPALAVRWIIDVLLSDHTPTLLWLLTAGAGALVASYVGVGLARARVLVALETRLDREFNQRLFGHLIRLPYGFFMRQTSGDLAARLSATHSLRDALASGLVPALLDVLLVVLYLGVLVALSPVFGMVATLLGATQALLVAVTSAKVRQLTQQELESQAQLQSEALDTLTGIATIKAMGAEGPALSRWQRIFDSYEKRSVPRRLLVGRVTALLGSSRVVVPLLLLALVAGQVSNGSLTLGTALALYTLSLSLLAPLGALVATYQQIQVIRPEFDRVRDVLETGSESEGSEALPDAGGEIRVERLGFHYTASGPPVLTEIDLRVPPGSKIAVVGRSGSGKSTLGLLLLGLLRPTQGRVLHDGVDIQELRLADLRSRVGVVFQDPFLISGTVRENIVFGLDHVPTDSEVLRAARIASIHDEIIAMPRGYDTFVGERGAGLSGGQRQRLALARAVVRQPRLLLLDEATSHLDVDTEARVERALSPLGCTRVVIAHRLSTVRDADLIVVLHDGRIVEQASHAELVERNGQYARLMTAQRTDAF